MPQKNDIKKRNKKELIDITFATIEYTKLKHKILSGFVWLLILPYSLLGHNIPKVLFVNDIT